MKVFITGATGFIGRATTQELIRSGHQVVGLVRDPKGAALLKSMGAESVVGRMDDSEILSQAARASDGVLHLAFVHGFSSMSFGTKVRVILGGLTQGMVMSFVSTIVRIDQQAIQAIAAGLKGSNKPFVNIIGTLSLKSGKLATEMDPIDPQAVGGPRGTAETLMKSLANSGIRTAVIRLPPLVHGEDDKTGFLPTLIKAAKKFGASAYMGDGANRWAAVHRLDVASLLRLALEKGAPGAVYHGVGDEGIPVKIIAEAIGKQLNLPTVSKAGKDAQKHFNFLSFFLATDNPASSHWTQAQLGWKPTHPDLMDDIKSGIYFK